MRFWLLAATCCLLACSDDGGERADDDAGTSDGGLSWRRCGNRAAAFECATFTAPAQAGSTTIGLARLQATGTRLGSLVWNPGGPGASAIESLPDLVEQLKGSKVLEQYDLVAMDPRGVGNSDPILCHSKLTELYGVDPTPSDDQGWAAIDAIAKQFAEECANKYAVDRLSEMRTVNVVKDLDLLREQLGEEKLNFLGFSYGAGLGAYYAAAYPERVGKLVLDGPPDLAQDTFASSLLQAQGFERALANYFAWCDDKRCKWAAGNPAQTFAALLQQVEAAPFPSPNSNRPCGPGEFLQGVITFLYAGEEGWEYTSDDLLLASRGDGSGLVDSTDIYLGAYETGGYSNITEANFAVNCADEVPLTLAEIRAHEAEYRAAAPIFGSLILSHLTTCVHWPVRGERPPIPTNVSTAPILVVGTTQDPATPYAGVQATATRLGAAAHLFSYDGEGHTAYARGIPCVDAVVDAYLLNGTLPTAGQTCSDGVATKSISRAVPIIRR